MKKLLKSIYKFIRGWDLVWMPLLAKLTGKLICKVRAPVTDIEGRALMIYITHPFKRNTNRRHTNMQESIAMADVLAELGLVVDVMDFRNPYRIKLDHYDLIVGFGDVFEKLFYEKNKAIKVHYATGAPQSVHCFAEVSRIQHLRANRKLKVYPKRVLDRSWPCSELLSDAIISVTDGWAKRQFQMRNTNVYSVPITSLSKVSRVDIDLANKLPNHFVWFGSLGAVHKGLDLCLEAMKSHGDIVLHVCGDVERENDFYSIYERALNAPNVKYHGFIDVASNAMREIMSVASFVVLPSCSEGCATSVLTCMAWGCIPVVTEQCGIDFPSEVLIKETSVSAVNRAMDDCLKMEVENRKLLMEQSIEWIASRHSIENYKTSLTKALGEIIRAKEKQ